MWFSKFNMNHFNYFWMITDIHYESESFLMLLTRHVFQASHLFSSVCVCTLKLLSSCLTLWDHMDYSLPRSSVHGILQAGMLEWVAKPSSRGSSQSSNGTYVSGIADGFFTHWATWEACVWVHVCVCVLYICNFIYIFWPYHTACRILISRLGIEPMTPEMKAKHLNHWTAREFW